MLGPVGCRNVVLTGWRGLGSLATVQKCMHQLLGPSARVWEQCRRDGRFVRMFGKRSGSSLLPRAAHPADPHI